MSKLLAVLIPILAAAQQPQFTNAKLETRAATSIATQIGGVSGPAWIGYAVQTPPGSHQTDCSRSLENERGGYRSTGTSAGSVAVLYRVENGVGKIRTFSTGCELDAGGLPVVWLTGVRQEDSIQYLASLASGKDNLADGAMVAIAQHASAAADRALEAFTAPSHTERIREKAAFWLGASRGKTGLAALKRMLGQDVSEHLREKVIFAVYVSHEPESDDILIDAARNGASSHAREKALFWVAQKAGRRAAETIRTAIENDPDTRVKRHAVFTLSQLKNGEGVPLLIQVARNNGDPEVRKQAMFWLGQSKDPRALEFFEEVLKK